MASGIGRRSPTANRTTKPDVHSRPSPKRKQGIPCQIRARGLYGASQSRQLLTVATILTLSLLGFRKLPPVVNLAVESHGWIVWMWSMKSAHKPKTCDIPEESRISVSHDTMVIPGDPGRQEKPRGRNTNPNQTKKRHGSVPPGHDTTHVRKRAIQDQNKTKQRRKPPRSSKPNSSNCRCLFEPCAVWCVPVAALYGVAVVWTADEELV